MGKTIGPCVPCSVDVDTVHGCCKTIGLSLFCSKQVCCCRVKPRDRESENIPNRTKVKVLFSVFNLQAVLYYCCVFNVMNYPMIIITPCNWYCKNAQFSNRMTSHNSPESKVLDRVGATKGFLSTIAHIVIYLELT